MRQLSGLDAGFLYIESVETPMHVGSLTLFALPEAIANSADPLNAFATRVREHMRERIPLSPLLHQRLALMPLDLGHPVWVDAGELDMDYHIQVQNLKTGRSPDARQHALENWVARCHAELLDRNKPLWQFVLTLGPRAGEIALYSKVHHAALDGAAGVALASAILDLSPEPRALNTNEAESTKKPSKAPSRSKLLGSLFSNTLAQYAKIARALPSAVKKVVSATLETGVSGALATGKSLLAPKTPFNAQIGSARSYRTLSLPLKELKAISATLECTLNDCVLTLCSGALRRYLQQHKHLPKSSLIAAVPISLREAGDRRTNNQVTMLPASLGTDQKTIAARLERVKAAMDGLKSTTAQFKDAIPTDYPSLGAPWLVSGLAQLYGKTRLADRINLPVNLVISNVPGPRVPLYLAGATLLAYFPVSIVIHGLALNITLHSYMDRLDFGLIACPKAVPELSEVITAIEAEHQELKALAAQMLLGGGKARLASARATSTPRPSAAKPAAKSAAKPGAATKRSASVRAKTTSEAKR
jgi:diacylglycerol O-acyltransferase / wax synthase